MGILLFRVCRIFAFWLFWESSKEIFLIVCIKQIIAILIVEATHVSY